MGCLICKSQDHLNKSPDYVENPLLPHQPTPQTADALHNIIRKLADHWVVSGLCFMITLAVGIFVYFEYSRPPPQTACGDLDAWLASMSLKSAERDPYGVTICSAQSHPSLKMCAPVCINQNQYRSRANQLTPLLTTPSIRCSSNGDFELWDSTNKKAVDGIQCVDKPSRSVAQNVISYVTFTKAQHCHDYITLENEVFATGLHHRMPCAKYSNSALSVVAIYKSVMVGYVMAYRPLAKDIKNLGVKPGQDEKLMYIADLGVAHDFRGLRIGGKLLAEAQGACLDCTHILLHCSSLNKKGMKVYKRLGFKIVKRISKGAYYENAEALVYKRQVSVANIDPHALSNAMVRPPSPDFADVDFDLDLFVVKSDM